MNIPFEHVKIGQVFLHKDNQFGNERWVKVRENFACLESGGVETTFESNSMVKVVS